MRFACFAFFALVALALMPAAAHAAAGMAGPLHYERLFYYREGDLAKKSFYAHSGSIDILAPQTYALAADGTLDGTLDPKLASFAKKHRIQITPVVTNDRFSQDSYQGMLGDGAKERVALDALVMEAKNRGYAGWQLDFEQMRIEYRDRYSAFVATTSARLHKAGLKFSVAVVAKVSDDPADYKAGLYENLIGVYDYAALAHSADFISLMSYDEPASPGPVVEYPWLVRVLAYARTYIPRTKLSLGIPLYYWQWDGSTGKRIGIGGAEGIENVFKNHKDVEVSYDAVQQAPSLFYQSGGTSYLLYYENARSVAAKIALVKRRGLRGASFWALGLELPSIYKAIKE